MISKDQHLEYDDAMNFFYESEVFDKFQDIETGLYRESSAYIIAVGRCGSFIFH